jgi:hypothetical protein
MTGIIDLNGRRAPVVYTVTIAHHYDGTLEFNIENVADDERSREAVLNAFRRISGADEEIEKLTADLKQAVWSDSEYCASLDKAVKDAVKEVSYWSTETGKRDARIAELVAALEPFAIKDTEVTPERQYYDMLVKHEDRVRARAALKGEK